MRIIRQAISPGPNVSAKARLGTQAFYSLGLPIGPDRNFVFGAPVWIVARRQLAAKYLPVGRPATAVAASNDQQPLFYGS
jgi:hypothetical protein